ncbi:CotO family spore coat protein [Bacillus sp. BP-3]|uniref:CotO family spore coat protein n=1 Tax=Bacillus sp. BP-3 TaxID=3022773 RepID=UPI00232C5376|nr:CotO family spore coat protein [Bacillus sp. BP-3]
MGKQIKKIENQPLLYIHHLDLYKLQRHMQQSVIVKQIERTAEVKESEIEEVKESETEDMEKRKQTQGGVEEMHVADQHNVQIDPTEEESLEQDKESFVESSSSAWQNKSFKDMNNEEKIYFLLNQPHYIPNVKCIVKTEKASYVGVITSYENGVLQMVIPSHIGNFPLNIEEVVSIRMTGL